MPKDHRALKDQLIQGDFFEDDRCKRCIFCTDLRRKAHQVVAEYDKRADVENLVGESKREGLAAKVITVSNRDKLRNISNSRRIYLIDLMKVARFALQNAASVFGLMLTTEAMIAEKPEKEKETAMPPGGMGEDMY